MDVENTIYLRIQYTIEFVKKCADARISCPYERIAQTAHPTVGKMIGDERTRSEMYGDMSRSGTACDPHTLSRKDEIKIK